MDVAWKRLSQVAVIAISGYIIADIIGQRFDQFLTYLGQINPVIFLGAAVLLIVHMIVGRYTWKMIMGYMGHPLSVIRAMTLISLFQVGSYLPGGFWHFLGIGYWAEREDIPKEVSTTGTVINAVANLIVALILFFTLGWFLLPTAGVEKYLAAIVVIPAGLVAIHPRVFYPVLNRALPLIGRDPIDAVLTYRHLLAIMAVDVITWAMKGVILYGILSAVTTVPVAHIPAFTAMYAGAWAVGFLLIFLPAGLGAREVTLIYFLAGMPGITQGLAALAAIAFRVIALSSEFVLAGLFWTIREWQDRG
jgi:hypothetical protein